MQSSRQDEIIKEVEATFSEEDICVICLEKVSEKAKAIPCGHHSFDFLCLVSWLEQNSWCPLCKQDVSTVEYDEDESSNVKTYAVKSTKKQEEKSSRTTYPLPVSRRRHDNVPRGPRPRPYIEAPRPSFDTALARRRNVYRRKTYSLHVGTNRISRFQDLTPSKIAGDEHLISRARMWIRRELRVFEFLYSSNSGESSEATRTTPNGEFLLEYIIAILKTVDLKGSTGQAEDLLQEFLGRENARLFLHELGAWLRSPYMTLEAWDRHVQYAEGSGLKRSNEEELVNQRRAPPSMRRGRGVRRYERYIPD